MEIQRARPFSRMKNGFQIAQTAPRGDRKDSLEQKGSVIIVSSESAIRRERIRKALDILKREGRGKNLLQAQRSKEKLRGSCSPQGRKNLS